jgi:predicted DNA-binding helix-hairpin-helix protein
LSTCPTRSFVLKLHKDKIMNNFTRLNQLSQYMQLEPAEDAACSRRSVHGNPSEVYISSAVLPNGKRIKLMKSLLTSACERNCYYCPFRAGGDFRRETFKPEEMASTFISLYRAGLVEGIFLSSGIAGGGVRTQDKLIATAEILRKKYHYRDYLHLKLMPGAEHEQVLQSMLLADRVSVNLEAPNSNRLEKLAPKKVFLSELLQTLRWVDEIRQSQSPHLAWKGRWPSMTTQFVVGAVGDTDLELLTTTANLHKHLGLGRAYFSAFRPIAGTPFENLTPASPLREHRLYQASFLLRDYGFDLEELPFQNEGRLPLDMDPKRAWASSHLEADPIDVNRADRRQLLRIPGIGPKGASAILAARRKGALRTPEDLRKIGVNPARPLPYILLNGVRPARQLAFW